MKITVTGINKDEAVFVEGSSALGWSATFGCPLVTGEVIIVPARGHEDDLRPGAEIFVETSFQSVDNVAVVPKPPAVESMRRLSDSCEYEVCGLVIACAPQGNVRVSVRGLEFTLHREDLGDLQPQVNDYLRFAVHRLTFWDCSE